MAALARQLARRHEVTVLTSRAGELAAQSNDQGVQVVRVPVFFRRQLAVANFPSMLAYLPSGFVRGLSLRRQQFDVINTHFVVPTGPLGHALARWHHLPNVLSVHGGDLFDPSKRSSPHLHAPLRAAVRWLLAAADDVVGQSRDTVRHVNDLYGVHREVGLIPLGIERPPARVVGVARDVRPAARRLRHGHDRAAGRAQGDARSSSTCWPRARSRMRICSSSATVRMPLRSGSAQPSSASRTACTCPARSRTRKSTPRSRSPMLSSRPVSTRASAWCSWKRWRAGCRSSVTTAAGRRISWRAARPASSSSSTTRVAFTHAVRAIHADIYLRRRLGQRNRQTVENYFIDSCAARYEQVFEAAIDRRLAAHRGVAPTSLA